MPATYRQLSLSEIATLESNGCSAENWNEIEVGSGFSAANMRNVLFEGRVRLGANGSRLRDRNGIVRISGIYNALIIACSIGDNVFISDIGQYVAGYDIEDEAYIENTGCVVCSGQSTFGNGTEVRTINENGGRALPIFEGLSAQTAYIMAMYRHRPALGDAMRGMVAEYCEQTAASRGRIGRRAYIAGCGTIRDVNFGDHARAEGALSLDNGTLSSCEQAPAHIGIGVTARNFICMPGGRVDDGATIERCFVGEACRIGSGFSAVDCLFFANCEMSNGEAISVFAGPYTVSHHKSSLLIAGYFLFFNAGSGTNQSNHMFKAGPVHEGIHERGVKFASNAYTMLPTREGAYTVVIGRHDNHHDTQAFPYSILTEEDGRSSLIPAGNLTGHGTMRDFEKWPQRDERKGPKLDLLNFTEHTPYIGQKTLRALDICRTLLAKEGIDTHNYKRLRIKTVLLKRGAGLYQSLLDATIGEILKRGCGQAVEPCLHWVDMAGMFTPKSVVDSLLSQIENGEITTFTALNNALRAIHEAFDDHAHAWALAALTEQLGHEPSAGDIGSAIEKGIEASERLRALRTEDLAKDCSGETMMIGYGIDAEGKEETEADFKAVRGL